MPSTASIVQDRLGAVNAGAMDVNAACAGFVYALSMAAGQIESGRAKNILVIGADELSIYLNWKDRNTCILFGDGAGAVLLKAGEEPGILSSTVGSDGSGARLLTIKGGGSRFRTNSNGKAPTASQFLEMNGPQVFRWATQMMTAAAEEVIVASGLTTQEIDLFIPHQANMRIIEAAAKRLGLPPEKVFANVDRYGNTSAASIPIALCEALDKGLITVGSNVVLTSFGAGLSWAAVALRWAVEIPAQRSPWVPFRQGLETRVAAVRSVLRRQQRRVGTVIDETLHREP
jgi:3-oxoacyl-[acyl-carrier-protein] synthase-3